MNKVGTLSFLYSHVFPLSLLWTELSYAYCSCYQWRSLVMYCCVVIYLSCNVCSIVLIFNPAFVCGHLPHDAGPGLRKTRVEQLGVPNLLGMVHLLGGKLNILNQ